MDTQAHKCKWCKKAYHHIKINQQYCSSKCRQAAYRQRKRSEIQKLHREEQPYLLLQCQHCQGMFWAKRRHAQFCSISCRSLAHRYMKASLLRVLSGEYGIPVLKAADMVETQSIKKLRQLLEGAGYQYSPRLREWNKASSSGEYLP